MIDGILRTRQVAAISLPLPASQPAISAIKANSLLKQLMPLVIATCVKVTMLFFKSIIAVLFHNSAKILPIRMRLVQLKPPA